MLDEIEVGFDNACGVVILAPHWAHEYTNGKHAAADVLELINGSNIKTFDGNDEEFLAYLNENDGLNGYDHVFTVAELAALLKNRQIEVEEDATYIRDECVISGRNEKEFFTALLSHSGVSHA